MERLSVAQQDRLISVCATDPNACRKEYGDIPANSMLIRDAIDRVLGDSDIPWQMKADMGPLLSQQIDAEGVVSSTEFAERLARTYGIDKERAELLSGAVLGQLPAGGEGGSHRQRAIRYMAKQVRITKKMSDTSRIRTQLERRRNF